MKKGDLNSIVMLTKKLKEKLMEGTLSISGLGYGESLCDYATLYVKDGKYYINTDVREYAIGEKEVDEIISDLVWSLERAKKLDNFAQKYGFAGFNYMPVKYEYGAVVVEEEPGWFKHELIHITPLPGGGVLRWKFVNGLPVEI